MRDLLHRPAPLKIYEHNTKSDFSHSYIPTNASAPSSPNAVVFAPPLSLSMCFPVNCSEHRNTENCENPLFHNYSVFDVGHDKFPVSISFVESNPRKEKKKDEKRRIPGSWYD